MMSLVKMIRESDPVTIGGLAIGIGLFGAFLFGFFFGF